MKSTYTTRIRLLSLFIFLFALLIIGKLYMLQIVNNEMYTNKADRQYSTTGTGVFSRGTIFFQNKDGSLVSAATLKSGFIIAINPQILKDPETVYEKLNALLPLDRDVFLAKASKKNDPYEEVAKHVDEDIGKQVGALSIPGLKVYKDKWRFYPGGNVAAHTIGFLGFKGNEYAGRYGLESQYESVLARTDTAYVNFFAQIFSNIKQTTTGDSLKQEGDIVTTIEPTVQSFFQEVLASTTAKWDADYVGGIIINPTTGEIYAMDTYPTFDPNNTQAEKNIQVFSNRLVEDTYEMGSIIKPLTIAAGIDKGLITAHSTYDDTGSIMVNGKKISNFDGKARGVVDMQQVLSQSLNLGVAHVVRLLGNTQFTDYMYKFGLNEKTGIDLPNEGRNQVKNLEAPRDLEHVTASFGQGIALTPMSTVRALSAIANGGLLIHPHVVKKINYKIGLVDEPAIELGNRVIKKETADEVSRMMVYSVDHVLSNGAIKLENYSVAAKTGTAQIAKSGGGGYYDDRFLHSFVGFFPAYNPKFLIFFFAYNPKGAKYGSETLTMPFSDTVRFLINYYEVPPDR
jgi:cell division protein FtsI/penicillin-binding protein 2